MWWKIILGVIGLAVVGFIGMVIKMAITEAKEETRYIEMASKSENLFGADVRIGRRRCPYRSARMSVSVDADVRIDRRRWF